MIVQNSFWSDLLNLRSNLKPFLILQYHVHRACALKNADFLNYIIQYLLQKCILHLHFKG